MTKIVLVALADDVRRETDSGTESLLILLDLSAAFSAIIHGLSF